MTQGKNGNGGCATYLHHGTGECIAPRRATQACVWKLLIGADIRDTGYAPRDRLLLGKQTAQPAGTEGDAACAPSMIGACRLAGSAPRRSRPLSAYGAPSANRRCQSRTAWTDASRMPRRRRSRRMQGNRHAQHTRTRSVRGPLGQASAAP